MKGLRDVIGRNMLFPALRLMRMQTGLMSDPLKLREAAARLDRACFVRASIGPPKPRS